MKTLLITIQPQTAFASALKGDTLFGQLCWSLYYLFSEEKLISLLKQYHQSPFVVISDPFPAGYIPMPVLPGRFTGLDKVNASERKKAKKKNWLRCNDFQNSVDEWQNKAKSEREILPDSLHSLLMEKDQPHNSINRKTQTTGEEGFSPFQLKQYWYHPEVELNLYVVLDEQQFSIDELQQSLNLCGSSGYGKEASTGLGKFTVTSINEKIWPIQKNANAWLNLAPVIPQGLKWQVDKCFYQPFTRFGRHGDKLAVSGQPFKNAILMAQTAAVLTPEKYQHAYYTGSALGGISSQFGNLSLCQPESVHQGYSPVLNIHL